MYSKRNAKANNLVLFLLEPYPFKIINHHYFIDNDDFLNVLCGKAYS
jgi:hypothetical protein